MVSTTTYVIITPARNEANYIEKTIESVSTQTILPIEWIIVDDGSDDTTPDIVSIYSSRFRWIRLIRRENRGYRKSGAGVMEAFYDGFAELHQAGWNYLVKLDADLTFERDYFERCFKYFEQNPKLGIGGGKVFNNIQGKLEFEPHPRFHVRGATKIYRHECWDTISGLIKTTGWDTIDEVKANMLGWQTYTFDAPSLVHHRITGGADGIFRDYVKNGMGSFIIGYHPLFLLLKSVSLFFGKAGIKGAIGLLYGFSQGYIKNIPRAEGKDVIRYLRRQQLNRLLFRDTIWK